MTRNLEAWTLCLAGLLVLALCAMAVPNATPSARAEQSTTTDSSTPATTEETTQDGQQDESPSAPSFFPGVRGISGKELERIIQEREQRKAEEERKARRYAENRQTKPEEKKADVPARESDKKPAETPKAAPTPPRTEPAVKENPLSEEASEFLRKQKLSTARVEFVLAKANEIRADAEKDASAMANEALILYILQYTKRSTSETQAYQATLRLPLAVYQYVFDQTQQALAFDRKSRPADLPPQAVAVADDCLRRLKVVWTASLLASAELYTRLRQFDAAESIYAALRKEHPRDQVIDKSYKVCVAVKNVEKPTTPPGVRTGGGNTGRLYDNDNSTGEPSTPAENYTKKYTR